MFFLHLASKQLQAVTMDLVKQSFGNAYYEKAMECVKALREETIKARSYRGPDLHPLPRS